MISNIDIVKRALKLAEKGDMETLGELMSDDFAFTGATPQPMNKTQFIELIQTLVTAIPDWQFNATNVSAAGDNVRMVNRITGRNTGRLNFPAMGLNSVPPTGQRVELPPETIDTVVRNGKIVAYIATHAQGGGLVGILTQLGIKVPATAGSK